MRSLKWKLVLIYVALVFIVMVISGTFIMLRVTTLETDRLRSELSKHAQLIYGEVVSRKPPDLFTESLLQIAASPSYSSQIQSSILSGDGVTLASNASSLSAVPPQYNNAAVISAISGNERFDKGKWADANGVIREWLNYALPCEADGEKYIIYIQTDIAPVIQKTESITGIILLASIIALILAIIMGIVFADTITRPIITLTKRAKEMARGRLNVSAPVKSHDEIGQLTRNFNFMSAELSNTVSAISSEKNKLEILLHNMTDGVLAFDRRGFAIHVNAAAKEMLGASDSEVTLSELEAIFGIEADIFELLQDGEPLRESAELDGIYVAASFAPYTDVSGRAEGIVAVLQDLTHQKKLDDMRKEFVANVSHEIRTPLTTIKSYAETLIDGALSNEETARSFISTIESEADRMTLLVKDLLQLSSLDNKKLNMNFEAIDLGELVEANVMHCKILADAKKHTVVYEKPRYPVMVAADKGRATQVLTNILSNAIKYSKEGALINIEIHEYEDYASACIEDNGIGIPKEDLDRIFERFYRVDKARSRSMGGTGLGLAIAKEIMEAMNGYILAESAPDKGTAMTVFFNRRGFDNARVE